MRHILLAENVFPEEHRVHYRVPVGGGAVLFDIRHVGDDYYDRNWQANILASRRFDRRGFYVPDETNHFYSLLYHALFQKPKLKPDYRRRLHWLAQATGIPMAGVDAAVGDYELCEVLWSFLQRHGYSVPRPLDRSVHFQPLRLRAPIAV